MSKLNKEIKKLKKDIKKFLNTRTITFVLILIVVSLIWFKYVAGIILLVIFLPITFITIRYSKMVPHVAIESNTAMTYFIGYTFGPVAALIYGPLVGISCYALNSFISLGYMTTPIIAGVTGALVAILKNAFGFSFAQAFFISLVVRTLIAFPWFMMFYDPIEVFSHQISQFFSNLIIYLPLLSALYGVIAPFV